MFLCSYLHTNIHTNRHTYTHKVLVYVHREASMSHLVYLLNVFYVRSPLAEPEEIPPSPPNTIHTHSSPRLWRRIYGLSDELPPRNLFLIHVIFAICITKISFENNVLCEPKTKKKPTIDRINILCTLSFLKILGNGVCYTDGHNALKNPSCGISSLLNILW